MINATDAEVLPFGQNFGVTAVAFTGQTNRLIIENNPVNHGSDMVDFAVPAL